MLRNSGPPVAPALVRRPPLLSSSCAVERAISKSTIACFCSSDSAFDAWAGHSCIERLLKQVASKSPGFVAKVIGSVPVWVEDSRPPHITVLMNGRFVDGNGRR